MRIAIIETGSPPQGLAAAYGDYPAMMLRMLEAHSSRLDFTIVRAASGEILPRAGDFDGFLLTGSPAGVYEDHSWIAPLKELVRAAADANRPQVGICFGHQLMAEGFGGRVEKSARGWGVGVHDYDVRSSEPWMRTAPARIAAIASHQDQVVAAPLGSRTLAASEFCAHAALAYAQGPAISFQMHPEFTRDYARALLDLRKERFAPPLYDDARASLARSNDGELIARWIARFFEEHAR